MLDYVATGSLIHFTSLALKPDILHDGVALKALFGGTSVCFYVPFIHIIQQADVQFHSCTCQ